MLICDRRVLPLASWLSAHVHSLFEFAAVQQAHIYRGRVDRVQSASRFTYEIRSWAIKIAAFAGQVFLARTSVDHVLLKIQGH